MKEVTEIIKIFNSIRLSWDEYPNEERIALLSKTEDLCTWINDNTSPFGEEEELVK